MEEGVEYMYPDVGRGIEYVSWRMEEGVEYYVSWRREEGLEYVSCRKK